jgi:signal transduction histidine kinase
MNFLKKIKFVIVVLYVISAGISINQLQAQEPSSKTAIRINPDAGIIEKYNSLVMYYRFYKPDSAIYFANLALEISVKNKDFKGIGEMHNQIGIINENQGKLNQAEKRYQAAIAAFKKINFKEGLADEYNRLGVLKLRRADYPEATQFFVNALKIYESVKSTKGIVECYLKLATTHERQNNLDLAYSYYKKVEKLDKKLPFSGLTLAIYNGIGWIFLRKGEVNKSLLYFEKGYKISNSPQYQSLHLAFAANLGSAYAKLGRYKDAREILNTNLPIAVHNKFYMREMQLLSALSDAWANEDFNKAKAYIDSCISKSLAHGDTETYIRAIKSLSSLYEGHHDYKMALKLSRAERKTSDSLFNLKRALEIANLNSSYQLQKSNADNNQLKLTNHKNLMVRGGMLMVSCIILLILIITIYFYLRSKKLNRQMIEVNKSLTGLNVELQAHHAVKDKMFSIIGHDLRSPLANVIGILALLNDDDLSGAERKEIIEKLSVHSKTSMQMLDNLLTWGQAQVKGIYLSQQYVDVKEIIVKNITLLRVPLDEKKIIIEDNIVQHTMIWADPAHVDFVVRNLISNAIKYCPPAGNIVITSAEERPGYTSFFVKDNGLGIKKDKLSTIFHIQSESTPGTGGEKGTGLGLIMCKGFIIANGGEISVDSTEGSGSTFKFTLQNQEPVQISKREP